MEVKGKKSEIMSDLDCITLAVLRELGGIGPYFEFLHNLTNKVFLKFLVSDDVEEGEEE